MVGCRFIGGKFGGEKECVEVGGLGGYYLLSVFVCYDCFGFFIRFFYLVVVRFVKLCVIILVL